MPDFTPYKLEEERSTKKDIFTVRLNDEERAILDDAKKVLEQHKDSTALKTLAVLGYHVIHDTLTGKVVKAIFKNKKNNRRVGLEEI